MHKTKHSTRVPTQVSAQIINSFRPF